ncbi:MAG: chemotaxis protein CheW [Oscillospiraceae bacterium]|nr:chemotaxis protein CheW [Oscillospiraceae bacterium]
MSTDDITQTEFVNQALASVSEMDGKYLTFWTDKQLFGIPISDVVQIVGMQEVTKLPNFPAYIKGIINLRGIIIPLIDVRLRLNKPETVYTERTCIIVTSIREKEIGFIVDTVNEVTAIDKGQIVPPPSVSGDGQNAYLTGVANQEDKVVLLMDAAKLLSDDIVDSLIKNGGNKNV